MLVVPELAMACINALTQSRPPSGIKTLRLVNKETRGILHKMITGYRMPSKLGDGGLPVLVELVEFLRTVTLQSLCVQFPTYVAAGKSLLASHHK